MDEIKKPEHLKRYIEKTYWIFVPFVLLNYPFRWLAYGLDKVAFLKILEYVGLLGVITAVYFYVSESSERLKTKHYQAWQVINTAQGKPGNGGRTDALQDLNNDGISLARVDLSTANLERIQLEGANLTKANLSGAVLTSANLSRANLRGANLSGAVLNKANLSGIVVADANLSMANLRGANLSGADLTRANLSGANLVEDINANFSGAGYTHTITRTNLSGACFERANLSSASLNGVNLSGENLSRANLSGAIVGRVNLSRANLSDANLSGANLGDTNLSGAVLTGANLSGALVCGVNLSRADLNDANLSDIRCWEEIESIKEARIGRNGNTPEGFIEWAEKQGAINISEDTKKVEK